MFIAVLETAPPTVTYAMAYVFVMFVLCCLVAGWAAFGLMLLGYLQVRLEVAVITCGAHARSTPHNTAAGRRRRHRLESSGTPPIPHTRPRTA